MEEPQKILEELIGSRPEELNGEAKRLFEAIMKIADERDELLKERQADKEKIKELEEGLDNSSSRVTVLTRENTKLKYEVFNSIPKEKVIEALQDIEDYFDRLNVPDEDIEFIQSIEEELLKDGGE